MFESFIAFHVVQSNTATYQSVELDGQVTSHTFIFQLPINELLFIDFILVQLTKVSCFLYTCASVATAVQVLVASVVLLGTTGLIPNVLVQLIVWFPDNFTTSLSFALFAIVVAYPSYVVTFPDVIPEFRASSCACVNGVSLIVYWYSQPLL